MTTDKRLNDALSAWMREEVATRPLTDDAATLAALQLRMASKVKATFDRLYKIMGPV